jgi:predicted nuclease of predicted toxin-antitoxin system
LRFLCDNNIGSTIARALTAEGHEVERAIYAVPGAEDSLVMEYAVVNDCVLVTCDRDFGELVFRYGKRPPPAIVYIRFEPQNVVDILPRLFAVLDFTRLEHHITVIGDEGDRRTAFPRKSANDG